MSPRRPSGHRRCGHSADAPLAASGDDVGANRGGDTVADLTSTPLEPYGYLRLVDLGAEVDTMVANLAPGASVYVPGQSTLIDGG